MNAQHKIFIRAARAIEATVMLRSRCVIYTSYVETIFFEIPQLRSNSVIFFLQNSVYKKLKIFPDNFKN